MSPFVCNNSDLTRNYILVPSPRMGRVLERRVLLRIVFQVLNEVELILFNQSQIFWKILMCVTKTSQTEEGEKNPSNLHVLITSNHGIINSFFFSLILINCPLAACCSIPLHLDYTSYFFKYLYFFDAFIKQRQVVKHRSYFCRANI